MSNVVYFHGATRLPLPPSRVFEKALEDEWDSVLVIGYDEEGSLDIRSSVADAKELLWMLEKARQRLLEMSD